MSNAAPHSGQRCCARNLSAYPHPGQVRSQSGIGNRLRSTFESIRLLQTRLRASTSLHSTTRDGSAPRRRWSAHPDALTSLTRAHSLRPERIDNAQRRHPVPVERNKISRIGILTGGGDCPGLNAVIRVVTKAAIKQLGLEVYGIADGFLGLIENRMRKLEFGDVSNILTVGGTILGTSNKADPAHYATGKDADGNPIPELPGFERFDFGRKERSKFDK
ncbi:MAG: 6-phosphofructokinase [Planctomycetes bacterium]|nr:6-phosphofructokinase [Planctomycetota bacterium]